MRSWLLTFSHVGFGDVRFAVVCAVLSCFLRYANVVVFLGGFGVLQYASKQGRKSSGLQRCCLK